MTSRIWAAAFVVAIGVVTVSAQSSTQAPPRDAPQAPAAQDPPQRPPAPAPSPAPATPSERAPATPSDRDRPAKITLTGCIQRSAQSAVPGATGTAGAKSESSFMLNNVSKPTGTAGAASTSTASSYALDADDSKLAPHVGHKVEISGSLDQAGSSRAGSAPKLKVDNVKMIATSCSE
jgi:hypothetical protein